MTTLIPAERLTTGTYISVPGYDAVEVYEAKFDGYGYDLTYCTNDRYGWDATDNIYIPVGECVEFAGNGEPSLREPDLAELEALAEHRAAIASINGIAHFMSNLLTNSYADSLRAASGEEQSTSVAAE